jgi:hypothetical protein
VKVIEAVVAEVRPVPLIVKVRAPVAPVTLRPEKVATPFVAVG